MKKHLFLLGYCLCLTCLVQGQIEGPEDVCLSHLTYFSIADDPCYQSFDWFSPQSNALINPTNSDTSIAVLFWPGDTELEICVDIFNDCSMDTEQFCLEVTMHDVQHGSFEADVCLGDSINIDGHTFWVFGDTVETALLTTSHLGCDSVIHITLNSIPQVILNQEFQICDGSPVTFCNQSFSSAGVYYIDCESQFGCDTIYILQILKDSLIAEAGPEMTIDCNGMEVTLDGTGSTTGADIMYEWTASQCCINEGENTLSPKVSHQGWYYLKTTNSMTGCFAVDSVYVGGLEIDIEPATVDCGSSETSLQATITSPFNDYSFVWTTIDGDILTGDDSLSPTIRGTGTYCLEATTSGQLCNDRKCVLVTYDSLCFTIEGSVLVDENMDCLHNPADMPLSGWLVEATGSQGTFYGTTDSTGFYSIPVKQGSYTVSLSAPSNTYSICQNDISVNLSNIPPVPDLEFTDNCEVSSVEFTEVESLNPTTQRRSLLRTWVAKDGANNATTVTQMIDFDDTEPPLASNVPSDLTVDCGSDVPPVAAVHFTDDCQIISNEFKEEFITNSPTDEQILIRTWTATDAGGHQTKVEQFITIQDDQAPQVVSFPPNISIACSEDAPAPPAVEFIDDCIELSVDFSETLVIDSSTDERLLIREWLATDAAGNSATIQQIVTILDDIHPYLTSLVPVDTTVECLHDLPDLPDMEFEDNCSVASVEFADTLLYDSTISRNTLYRKWTARDGAGNPTVVGQSIIINDTFPPQHHVYITPPWDITVTCGDQIAPPQQVLFSDNCSGFLPTTSMIEFSESFLMPQVLCRTWTRIDDGGNHLTHKQTITIEDNEPPQVTIPPADTVAGCNFDSTGVVDFTVKADVPCPVMTVDFTNPILRRCFDNNYFYVNYCNEGSATAEDAYVEVSFDPDLSLVFSPMNYTDLGNNTYSFQLGNVAPDECGKFWIQTFLACDVEIGETHCSEAHIFPDDPCFPANPQWSGASLEIRASCSDSTRFTVSNVGTAPLSFPAGYIVIEDAVMYRPDEIKFLAPGDSVDVILPANGSTWRIELEQEPFHPFPDALVAWVEGCGEKMNGTIAKGLVSNRHLGDSELFQDNDCTQNQAPFDPNDKQGFPTGHGEDHLVRAENQIEYLIRFQNIGNDTAFNIVIIDTLDEKLDIASFRPGASSHLYDFEIFGEGVLKFHFKDIQLPDSTTNLLGSEGFVKYVISPEPAILPGEVIYNEAEIYFDFNDPIITNQTIHTIEKPKAFHINELELCSGEIFNGSEILVDTLMVDTVSSPVLDSFIFNYIKVLQNAEVSLSAAFCEGAGYNFYGQFLQAAGNYEFILTSVNGCDSIIHLALDLLENDTVALQIDICQGSEFTLGNQVLSVSGNYQEMFVSNKGCDSLVLLTLNVTDTLREELEVNLCDGEVYAFGGEILSEPGQYFSQEISVQGCDSTTILDLLYWPDYEEEWPATICEGDSITFNGQVFFEAGFYVNEMTSVHGCDSIEIFELIVLDSFVSEITASICHADTFDFNGQWITESGLYETVLSSVEGCDSTILLDLEVQAMFLDTIEVYVLYGDLYQGVPILADTVFTEVVLDQYNCEGLRTIYVYAVVATEENVADEISLSIFPNPAEGRFYVKFDLPKATPMTVEIFDFIGQKVLSEWYGEETSPGEDMLEISANHWAQGVYLVQIRMEDRIATGKILIK
ncbi:MAG: T9SS type A sorting domain-containing protein [Bacteroidota bacterium]